MFLRKRWSCECRHCRCLARIVIALSRCSAFGKIQYTKHPKHPSLLNKLLQTVGSSWFSRSHFLDACIMSVSHQFTPGYTPIRDSLRLSQSGICGRQRPQKWAKGGSYSRRPLPSLPNPPPFSLPLYPIPSSTPSTQANYKYLSYISSVFLIYTSMYMVVKFLFKKIPKQLCYANFNALLICVKEIR